MIKDINSNEIQILKSNLKKIINIKKLLYKRPINSKKDLRNRIVNQKLLCEEEIDTFLSKGNIFIVQKSSLKNDYLTTFLEMKRLIETTSTNDILAFGNGLLSIDKAIDIYINTVSSFLLKVDSLEENMYEYLKENNLIELETINNIKKVSINYDEEYDSDEYEERYSKIFEEEYPPEVFERIITDICKKYNINYEIEQYSEIIFNSQNVDSCYLELSKNCTSIYDEYINADDPIFEFIENFSDNPNVICFKNIIFDESLLNGINILFPDTGSGGFLSEVFTIGNNTYLTISENLYSEIVNEKIILLIITGLIKLGGKLKNVN